MRKHLIVLGTIFGVALVQATAYAGGLVTPTEVTITFTQISLVKAKDGKQLLLMNGSFPHTFKRSDADFSGSAFAGYSAPGGRYSGVNICYHSDRQVKIDGEIYNGSGGSIRPAPVLEPLPMSSRLRHPLQVQRPWTAIRLVRITSAH